MAEPSPSPYEAPLDLPGGDSQSPPAQTFKPPKRRRSKKPLLILLILIALVGLGYGGLKLLSKPKPAPATPAHDAPDSANKTDSLPTSSQMKNFAAETLAVEFQYPSDWTVTEKDGTITVKSPNFDYKSADAGTVHGYFRLYIRKTARDVDSKYIGRAVAMQPTEEITYTNPAPSQRKQTELSFFAYDEPTNFAFLMITPGFKLQKGDTLGAKYGKEAEAYIIVGGYSGTDNKDDLSFHPVTVAKIDEAEAVKQAINILKSLKVS